MTVGEAGALDNSGESLPPGFEGVSFSGIVFPYGLKHAQWNGQDAWIPATKQDVIEAEKRRTGISIDASCFENSCGLVSPTRCGGTCEAAFCVRRYDPVGKVYYCICTKNP